MVTARHTSTITSLAESITSSLGADMTQASGIDGSIRSDMKVKGQIFESLSKIAYFISDNLSDLQGSYVTGRSIAIEDVFLSSRLLALLMALGCCPVTYEGDGGASDTPPSTSSRVLYLTLQSSSRMRYVCTPSCNRVSSPLPLSVSRFLLQCLVMSLVLCTYTPPCIS